MKSIQKVIRAANPKDSRASAEWRRDANLDIALAATMARLPR